MPRYRAPSQRDDTDPQSLPFHAAGHSAEMHGSSDDDWMRATGLPTSARQVLRSIDSLSRRIEDLARELNCLGHFDTDDDDRPRAA